MRALTRDEKDMYIMGKLKCRNTGNFFPENFVQLRKVASKTLQNKASGNISCLCLIH